MTEKQQYLEIIDRFGGCRVVLYGDLVLDRFILGTPKRVSREAPVIILRHEDQRDVPGGGANALANLAALGVKVAAVAAVGDDEPGGALVAALNDRGIDTGRIVTVSGYRTPTKVRILGGGKSSLKHQVARYDIEDVLPGGGQWRSSLREHLGEEMKTAGAVAISDYGYGCVQTDVLQSLNDTTGPPPWLCLDSRYRIGSFTGIDGATPNLEELEAHCGRRLENDSEVAAGAEELRRDLGARFLLATRGNRGMTLVVADGEPCHIPVYGTDEVADVTGAGDTVLAVLTAALAAGAEPAAAAGLANIGAGLVVMKLGTATISAAEL
ncbi:MAG: PfkB family carbohydrate kinase, partial [Thermoanaerobaculales bacterium]|nr:PfkB family carbohydrate kinase [Thermoanaerobaculales bacterium]